MERSSADSHDRSRVAGGAGQTAPLAPPVAGVLFDLDGTLVDSLPGIAATIDSALESVGRPPCESGALRPLVGAPLESIFATLLGGPSGSSRAPAPAHGVDAASVSPELAALVQRCVAAYLDRYGTIAIPNTPLFPGVAALLADLAHAGVPLALVTTKRVRVAHAVLDATGIGRFFAAVVGGDSVPHAKPHPAPAQAALRALGLEAHAAVVVGDTTFDVGMARAAGCRAVGAGWGYQPAAVLLAAGADAVASEPAALRPFLLPGR